MSKLLTYIFSALFVLLCHTNSQAQQEYTICTTLSPPLSTKDHSGMLDEILIEAFRRTDSIINLVITPSERGLLNANSGIADGESNRIEGLSKNYTNLIQVPESNMTYEFMAFSKNKEIQINGWESINNLTVGFITGWKILEENVKSKQIIKADTADQLISLLENDRVDIILLDRYGGNYLLNKFGLKNIYAIEPPLAERKMFLYLNKHHSDLAHRIAATLRIMKEDGTFKKILDKHAKQH